MVGGGPCAFNPEPVAPFLDAICIGDGEECLPAIVAAQRRWRDSGAPREDLLWELTQIPGVYVPSLYTVHYADDGGVASVEPAPGLPARVRKAVVRDLDATHYPEGFPVPFMQVVHDRVGVEIQRGCMRGCRFCQAGYVYRPVRQRSPQRVQQLAGAGLRATGIEEYSLLSLSAGDYACMEPLLRNLMDAHGKDRSAISLPSMRLETLTPGIMDQIDRVRKTSFTVAPEAASDRLRAVINKVIDEDVLLDMVGEVFRRGWKGLKFYFMLGIPTEQRADLEAMVDLSRRALQRARRHNRSANITASVSTFVPKSHTPFQWATQAPLDEIRQRQAFLREGMRRARLGFRYHASDSSVLEGVFSRGDRRAGELIEEAWRLGARLDGWTEHLDLERWQEALRRTGFDPDSVNQRERGRDEVFPWAHIDSRVDPAWLWSDWQDALEAGFVPDCTTEPCYDCGVCDHREVHHRVFDDATPGAEPKHRFPRGPRSERAAADPQFVQLPRKLARKDNGVVDAVPPQGQSPGSAGARANRQRYEDQPAQPRGKAVPVPHGHESTRAERPDGENLKWADVFDTRLPTEWRLRAQVRYGKRGALVHLGHLEVMGAFRRALRRIEAPVLWSQGFHPQMKLTFGPPLPAGMGSSAEYMEVDLKRPLDLEDFARRLAATMPEGLPVIEVQQVPARGKAVQNRIARWVYRVESEDPAALSRGLALYGTGEPVVVEVDRKKGPVTVDLRGAVVDLRAADGAVELEVLSEGAGARIRDVLGGFFGPDSARGAAGWRVSRAGALFHNAPRTGSDT